MTSFKQQQQKVRILQSLSMFKMSTVNFKASLWSLWKLLYSFVDRFPMQAVPDHHLQRFLEFYDPWMTPVIVTLWEEEWLMGATSSIWNVESNWPHWSEIADFQELCAPLQRISSNVHHSLLLLLIDRSQSPHLLSGTLCHCLLDLPTLMTHLNLV